MHRHLLALALTLTVLATPVWAQTEPEPDTLGSPKGNHESWTCDSTAGWTCDPSDFSREIDVRFFPDGAPATGKPIGTVTAGRIRGTAVAGQCGGKANHGFVFLTPDTLKDGQSHTLHAYGVNIGQGLNKLLGGSPKTLTCQPAVTVNVASPRYPGANAGAQFSLTYRWDGTGTSTPYKVFVHFVDAAGTVLFQDDHFPPAPTDQWNGPVSYQHQITVPVTAFGNYAILAGLFDPAGGERLVLKAGAGVSAQAASRYRIGTLVVGSTFGFEAAGGIEIVRPVTAKCAADDIPDLTPRAFRDADGKVNLISSHFTTRRMVGTSLNDVSLDCRPVYRSVENPAFNDFRFREWMASTYTLDGRNISALIHNEWYPYAGGVTGCIPVPNVTQWVNAITLVVSNDQGLSYKHPADYLVVRPPAWTFPCDQGTIVYGAFAPSNIIKKENHFYALYQSERDPSGILPSGATCLMRTSNLAIGSAWEIWTANGWKTQADAVPLPLANIGKIHESVTFNKHLNKYVLIGQNWAPRHAVYVSVSSDLLNWSKPVMMTPAPNDDSDFIYPAFLDPADTSRNFENTEQMPYMYWVRKVGGVNLNRELVRRRIRFFVPSP
jgi:hypothetical protein